MQGKSRKSHTNMQKLREELKIMSINQLSCYHVAMEMYNIINHSSSDLLHEEFKVEQSRYNLRCHEDGTVKVPEKMKKSCTGFSYIGPKLWNHLPGHIRKTTIRGIFKDKMKDWIWESIPSVWNLSISEYKLKWPQMSRTRIVISKHPSGSASFERNFDLIWRERRLCHLDLKRTTTSLSFRRVRRDCHLDLNAANATCLIFNNNLFVRWQ